MSVINVSFCIFVNDCCVVLDLKKITALQNKLSVLCMKFTHAIQQSEFYGFVSCY